MKLLRRLAAHLRRQEPLDHTLADLERIYRAPAARRRNTRKENRP
ncbi:hypothetical protein [Streptomyces noursei]